jgi:asparagine N-glycosylation enzyme membrane subunit Stt3
MSLAEARDDPPRSLLSRLKRGGGAPNEFGKWLRANWSALLVLVFIFIIALFVRSYFAFEMSQENDYLVSGGSDSYYWRRIIDYNAETGKSLYWDWLINYPDGIRNPRPPFFSMSVAVPAVLAQGLFDSLSDATGFMFVWSTAFWGALTVVPVFFLGKEIFGRRVGLMAAFFLALMPSHVQRSVLSNADHDAIILFFIVLTFFFLLKAVKTQQHRRWVQSWRSMDSIRTGLGEYFSESRTPLLYSLMAGVAFACIIMIWVGYAYVAVLILAYYVIQVMLNTFKGVDSMAVTIIVMAAMGLGFLLSFPVYFEQSLIAVRFDIPVYLFLAAMAFGMLFVVARDYPWTLSLPAVGLMLVVGIFAIDAVNPALAEAIVSGQGYFAQNKLYSTIAEARAPQFSELAMSFGMVTFFLSMIGLVWALAKVPKKATAEYIFIVVWLAVAIFMALSAGRFMFNAAPAFALASGWVVVIIVDKLDFGSVRKALSGASGSLPSVIRKSIKIRHVVGVLFLAFFIVLPNVWYSVDAGIPSESKREYDKEIYNIMPSFMQPAEYDWLNGSNWYLGAFGYSLPLPGQYYPAAWSWFSEQDSEVAATVDKPAYVAWWDYGFEAVQQGDHPTVADNFQNGYQLTGNVIMAQSELEAVALFVYHLYSAAYSEADLRAEIHTLFEKYGVSSERMSYVKSGPGADLVAEVLADPDTYGPMASDLSDVNARITAGRVEIASVGEDALIGLYDEICEVTGWEIRYFNVDSRMFPLSGYSTGIFYAPAKLADRRLSEGGSIPVDFYEILAVDENGIPHALDEVTVDMVIVDYAIDYKDMFYNSMFYRAMCGIDGESIGLDNEGVPGYSGAMQSFAAMPGWNMSHFKMVYRTVYYSPYSIEEFPYHSSSLQAVGLEEGLELEAAIDAGTATGFVDDSSTWLYRSGTVFLEYYHGAYVNGTVTTEEGDPVGGLRVTIKDEYGIPHDTAFTDADGHYSVLSPFGHVSLVISEGATVNAVLQGSNTITTMEFEVTDDQAMRMKQDLDGDGVYDYIITKDYVMRGTLVTGDIYWDVDMEGNYSATADELISDVTVYATDIASGSVFEIDAPMGSYETYLPRGQYSFEASLLDTTITITELYNVSAGMNAEVNLGIAPCSVSGNLSTPDGSPVVGSTVKLVSTTEGLEYSAVTDSAGGFEIERVLFGSYQLVSSEEDRVIFDEWVNLDEGEASEEELTLFDKATLNYRVVDGASPVSYAAYMVVAEYDPESIVSGTTDKYGRVRVDVPVGEYSMYVMYADGSTKRSAMAKVDATEAGTYSGTLSLGDSVTIVGALKTPTGGVGSSLYMSFEAANGARLVTRTDRYGGFEVVLPVGSYDVVAVSLPAKGVYAETMEFMDDSTGIILKMSTAVTLSGTLWLDSDSSGDGSDAELGRYAPISVTYGDGIVYRTSAYSGGTFRFVVLRGEEVSIGLGAPGYEGWAVERSYSSDMSSYTLLATPDEVLVTGTFTSDGVGIRGVSISFLPDDILMDAAEVVTGVGGKFSVYLQPSAYTVSVDDAVATLVGVKYVYESEEKFSPSSSAITMDIGAVMKVEVYGNVLGAAEVTLIRFDGPETVSVDPVILSYSTYVLPGTYDVYATGIMSTKVYAEMASVDLGLHSQQVDLEMSEAYNVSGTVYVGTAAAKKTVTVAATSSVGITVTTTTDNLGKYWLNLPKGLYGITYFFEDSYKLGTQTLYVEYYGEELVTVGGGALTVSPTLSMTFDNSTFSGVVTGTDGTPLQATIELWTNSKYGLSTTFTTDPSGAFAAQVQPGTYTMYVKRYQDRRVVLTDIQLDRNEPLAMGIELESGVFLSGVVTVADAKASETVSVTRGDSQLEVVSDSSGYFNLLVPAGDYSVSSSATRVEGGITVSYSFSSDVTVGTDAVYVSADMERADKRSVAASWNSTLMQSALPGETVTYVFTVENTGNIADTYLCKVSSEGFEGTFTPETKLVDFGTNGNKATFVVELTVGDGIPSGENEVVVLVRSTTLTSVRTNLNLRVNVTPSYSVEISAGNAVDTVTDRTTTTTFTVTNTGNTAGEFALEVSNLGTLTELGWSARIVDDAGEEVESVTLEAFAEQELTVEFTALRGNVDSVDAIVLAYLVDDPSVNTYGTVSASAPDLVVGPGGLDVVRDDISYTYDMSIVYTNIALVIVLVGLLVSFFVIRRKKGLGGSRGSKK